MELNTAFGLALKQIRMQQGVTQEDFSGISSRTYLSVLERGLKGATIEKLEQLAGVLNVHPATILISAYLIKDSEESYQELINRIGAELEALKMPS
ncbi:helix-turn-helix domain-containing protein [Pseudomonas sp. ML96]|uniref:helix-turn-helix domain-containing protein n=1 Tax=Pseudomonas sp. ML96 TaxID=1523503 RepID=UPI0005BCD15C|nr:helix-turn-helix transcriptional regulator [Pseudomonas sp. ML96]